MFKAVYASGMIGKICVINGILSFKKDDGTLLFLSHSDPGITLLDDLGFFYDKDSCDFIIVDKKEIKSSYIEMPTETFGAFLRGNTSNLENCISFTTSVLTPYDTNNFNRVYTVKVSELNVMLGPDKDIVCWIFSNKKGDFAGKIDHSPKTLGLHVKVSESWDKNWKTNL